MNSRLTREESIVCFCLSYILIRPELNPERTMQNQESDNSLVISFLHLRALVGVLGIALPIVMLLYALLLSPCGGIEQSISAYYHTHMRNVFVGILCGVGVFMITYKGYETKDTIASTLAGIFAICVAMFPTSDESSCEHNGLVNGTIGEIHIIMALGLFAMFAYMSIKLFTLTGGNMTDKKKQRNVLYRVCGWTVVACIVLIAAHKFAGVFPAAMRPVFWLETIALLAFGTSWLTKGEGIKLLND